MRYWMTFAMTCLCAWCASAQETTPVEVATADEGQEEVAVNVDNNKKDKPEGGGCGCGGKPK